MSENNNSMLTGGLIDFGTAVAVLVPLLYTAGWSFANHYFRHFHLGLLGLDLKKEYLFLYSFWVVRDRLAAFVAALLVAALCFIGVRFCFQRLKTKESNTDANSETASAIKKSDLARALIIVFLPVLIISLFSFFYHLGSLAADATFRKQAENGFPSYPRVKVWLTKDAAKQAGKAAEEWSKGCYRLLLRNKDNLYIFYNDVYSAKAATDIIPKSKVRSVRILPVYRSSVECDS